MPVILATDKKGWGTRLVVLAIYLLLSAGGVTMIYPFLITLTSSFTDRFDYNRFSPVLRSLFSREDRFVRSLEGYFEDQIPDDVFRDRPATWGTWIATGEDDAGVRRFARGYLAVERQPEALARWRRMAADYARFNLDYDIRNTYCWYDFRDLAGFLRTKYGQLYLERHPEKAPRLGRGALRQAALRLMREEWGVPYPSFFDVKLEWEIRYPMHHTSWDYPHTTKARAFLNFKDAYRRLEFRPGARRQWQRFLGARGLARDTPWPMTAADARWPLFKEFVGTASPAAQTRPYLLKPEWIKYFNRPEVKERLGMGRTDAFTVADYNRLFEASYADLRDIPFPVPPNATPRLREAWRGFVAKYYPRRLMEIRVTPEVERKYQANLATFCRTIAYYNQVAKTNLADFAEIRLPRYENSELWRNFVAELPYDSLEIHSAETDYQRFLLATYGSLEGVNRAYGWNLDCIEEARLPLAEAMTVTFLNNEWRYYLGDLLGNYRMVFEYLFVRGRAFLNTMFLVALMILATLTVNPLAAYALSRFRLKWTEQILLFLLATMAFPGAVVAIPGFLLMRDLHLLNTFAALVLPSLANGMAIFILKGFFDGLPRELYEAATIDGAREWQIFFHITLPMTTPILAVNTLNAFIAAYNSWEWALLVCQKQSYWTLAVWLYQMSQTLAGAPYVIMAGFVFASIPTAIVFISCQKVILRGIVIPSMK